MYRNTAVPAVLDALEREAVNSFILKVGSTRGTPVSR